jgi:hypothetical protein
MITETFFLVEIPHAIRVRNFRDHAGRHPPGIMSHPSTAPLADFHDREDLWLP